MKYKYTCTSFMSFALNWEDFLARSVATVIDAVVGVVVGIWWGDVVVDGTELGTVNDNIAVGRSRRGSGTKQNCS